MNAFTGKATAYAQARPGYAAAALDFIFSFLPAQPVTADIGAGTGKWTAMLAARGSAVTAVEPNEDMFAKLLEISGIAAIQATAERTGLPSAIFDAVTCAQAFHWFEPTQFKKECKRILKPSGRIFVIYNTQSWMPQPELAWHDRAQKRMPEQQRKAALRAFFGDRMTCKFFPNPAVYDQEGYLAFLLSHSHAPREGDADYGRFVDSARAIFCRCSQNGQLQLPFETVVYYEEN